MTHRVDTWWTTATWTSSCRDCPWQVDGSHDFVVDAAARHSLPRPNGKVGAL